MSPSSVLPPFAAAVMRSPFTQFGSDLMERGLRRFGERRPLAMVGRSPALRELQRKISKVAGFQEPLLITGESGVGKELVARSVHLLGAQSAKAFVAVNCPQHQEGNLTVSELFGHEKGSFTGAVSERAGVFEQAKGGTVFLDEIGDLHMSAQRMLLRALAELEFTRLGGSRLQPMEVRLVAATNRTLEGLIARDAFRNDLFFRLRYFQLLVPPLREREDDWLLMANHQLRGLARRYGVDKQFDADSLQLLTRYAWPGNCRELANVVSMGYAMADGDRIAPPDFEQLLSTGQAAAPRDEAALLQQLASGRLQFWTDVHAPFLNRDFNRRELRELVRQALARAEGSYRRMLPLLGLVETDYQRLMDFLRHHDLKPCA
ncbi:sigma 54-interacting transcriptional regulator [Aquimonas sp.]|uniref:sigma 54-interacting transcriptional regulator n=1 Tax=Aquimonas sp. TaxID=1872588 RepID=UPI0037BF37FB